VRDVLVIALFVALAGLIAYQVYMLSWAKKAVDAVPRTVTALRVVNIVALTAAATVIALQLARG